MWVIRFYTGPLMGKQLPLKMGRNLIGRGTHCDVCIPSQGMSKEHATIEMYNDKIVISDLKSSNGTFVNGIQIRSQKINPKDKIAFHDILCDIAEHMPKKKSTRPKTQPAGPTYDGAVAYKQVYNPDLFAQPAATEAPATNFMAYIKKYVDEVVLPGVYKLGELIEFRILLALFVASFIVFVTALSTIPLMRILKSSIETESQDHALTIARALVQANQSALAQGLQSSLSVEVASREANVDRAYIISGVNGDVIAPSQLAGTYLSDIPFVQEARKRQSEAFEQTNDSTVVAMAPFKAYNSATGNLAVTAFSVVVYNMGKLRVDSGRTLSLFVEILFIAIIIGGILYFFLYKLIQRPVIELNNQLNAALRDGNAQISSVYQFPELQQLAININSAIHRGGGGFAGDNLKMSEIDRSLEMQNIVNLIGFAALTINPTDKAINSINDHFLNQIGSNQNWVGISVNSILDQALKLNLQGLIEKVVAAPTQISTDQLEISSQNYDLSAQAVYGSSQIAYIIVVFVPKAVG